MMSIRKIILFLLGVALLVVAVYVAKSIAAKRQFPRPRVSKTVTSVFTQTVENGDIPITISTSGQLMAKYRLELYAEVQGIFEGSAREFKPGVRYGKKEILLKINSDEHLATLRSQKSSLYNQVVLLLPDLRLDFPESFPQWQAYVSEFDLDGPLQALPEPLNEKEKLFISGKNIYTTFYNVKNLQERLIKYRLRAPYNGVLTEALVTPGTLIRVGQKLGTFISTSTYELEIPVNTRYADRVQPGQTVVVHNIERTKEWQGTVIRVNSLVDPSTQSIQVFVQLRGQGLREGMFLEADLEARRERNAFEMDRKLLIDEKQVFTVQDTVLELTDVEPAYFKETTVVVRGLQDGTEILAKPIPGAYRGMPVQVLENLEGSIE